MHRSEAETILFKTLGEPKLSATVTKTSNSGDNTASFLSTKNSIFALFVFVFGNFYFF